MSSEDRTGNPLPLADIPRVPAKDLTWEKLAQLYQSTQLLLVEGVTDGLTAVTAKTEKTTQAEEQQQKRRKTHESGHGDKGEVADDHKPFGLQGLQRLYREHLPHFIESWSVEKGPKRQTGLSPKDVLGGARPPEGNWYVSFIAQQNAGLVQDVLSSVPVSVPGFMGDCVSHSDCIWVFFGRNTAEAPMKGRPQHIDQVYHAGTWHVQVCGTKVWRLRPNPEGRWPSGTAPEIVKEAQAAQEVRKEAESPPELRVTVRAGDMLLINTRLWFHATEIPNTCMARDHLSLSYARDFHIANPGEEAVFPQPDMCNAEGPVASKALHAGQVILREAPSYCVQEASNRRTFLACNGCHCTMVSTPAVHLAMTLQQVGRNEVTPASSAMFGQFALPNLPQAHEHDDDPHHQDDPEDSDAEPPWRGSPEEIVRLGPPRSPSSSPVLSATSPLSSDVFCSTICATNAWRRYGGLLCLKNLPNTHPLARFRRLGLVHAHRRHEGTWSLAAQIITTLLCGPDRSRRSTSGDDSDELLGGLEQWLTQQAEQSDSQTWWRVVAQEERQREQEEHDGRWDHSEIGDENTNDVPQDSGRDGDHNDADQHDRLKRRKLVAGQADGGVPTAVVMTLDEHERLRVRVVDGRLVVCGWKGSADETESHCPAFMAGVREGDVVARVGKHSARKSVHDHEVLLKRLRAEANKAISEMVEEGFGESCLSLTWQFLCSNDDERSANVKPQTSPRAKHAGGPTDSDTTTGEKNAEDALATRSQQLHDLAFQAWSLLTEGLANRRFPAGPSSTASPTHTPALSSLRRLLPFAVFDRVLCQINTQSWQLTKGAIPSPISLYCASLGEIADGVEEDGEDREEWRSVVERSMGVLVPVVQHLVKRKVWERNRAIGASDDEGTDEGDGMSVMEIVGRAPAIFPSFQGRAIYPVVSTVPIARVGWPGNCEVLFVGPGTKATLVATHDIEAGEGLMFASGESDQENEGDEGDEGDGGFAEGSEDEAVVQL